MTLWITKFIVIILSFHTFLVQSRHFNEKNFADPKFSAPIINATVAVGRDAILSCQVHDLIQYKVAWLRVDTQTILTIQNHVITKNHRISIANTEKKIWELKVRDVHESDKGWYMCQINTDPMKSQLGYLNIVVSPDILDDPTSHDIIVTENENVTLTCAAIGSPTPTIMWRRETRLPIVSTGNHEDSPYHWSRKERSSKPLNTEMKEAYTFVGPIMQLPLITRHQAGPYLCIASNGIPPSVSKRIMVVVNFKPKIFVHHRVIYATINQKVTLECVSESFPNSVNYWIRGHPDHTSKDYVMGGHYETFVDDSGVSRVTMSLVIYINKPSDFGIYKCVAKNALGINEEVLKVIPANSKIMDSQLYQQTVYLGAFLNKNETVFDDFKFIKNIRSRSLIVGPCFLLIFMMMILISC